VQENPDKLQVVALAAGKNIPVLLEQIKVFRPQVVSVQDAEDVAKVKKVFPELMVVCGEAGLCQCATHPDAALVLVAVVGVAALKPTIEAIKLKKDIALASKEILVAAGSIVTELVKKHGVKMLPVDSEHSAIMQSAGPVLTTQGYFTYPVESIEKIILTASGGAFRGIPRHELAHKKPVDALKHPNWSMGKKITIDSATLINKGLEVIEAHWLFGLPYEKIDVVIHPQSIIHSMVEYVDSSVVAQMGLPDMRLPIQYAFFYPERQATNWPKLKFTDIKELTFREPDLHAFKGLRLAYEAGRLGGTMPAVFNAANEQAVELFLQGKIGFLDIAELIEKVMLAHKTVAQPQLLEIISSDQWARTEFVHLAQGIKLHV
jgi:1-deoxy-D-xylulose-5-phosphate reductoisomerase